jgi:hypothetical protein
VLVDKEIKTLAALDAADHRQFRVSVAGPAALMVTKLHKIRQRLSERRRMRLSDKDALDVLRLLQAVPTLELAEAFRRMGETAVARDVTREALTALLDLFSDPKATGAQMAARAAEGLAPEEQIAQSCAILTNDLLASLGAE